MPRLTSKQELINYCLRRLGEGVIKINITSDQLEDRYDDALNFYREYHYDATEHVYYKHQLTQDDIINRYIEIPDNLMRVSNIFPIKSSSYIGTGDLRDYSIREVLHNSLNKTMLYSRDYNNLTTTSTDQAGSKGSFSDIADYYLIQQQYETIEAILREHHSIRFSRHTNKVHIDINQSDLTIDYFLIIDGLLAIDPDENNDIYNDWWLQRYLTALIKRQWGDNLSKFQGVTLPGSVTFDAQQILSSAQDEINKLEDEIQEKFQLPALPIVV